MIGASTWGQGDSVRDELLAPSLTGIRRSFHGQTRGGGQEEELDCRDQAALFLAQGQCYGVKDPL